MYVIITLLLAAGLLLGGEALAVDKSFTRALKHAEIRGESGLDPNLIMVLAGVVVAVIVLVNVYQRAAKRAAKRVAAASERASAAAEEEKEAKVDIMQYASRLGFKIVEIQTLRLLASKIAPSDPGRLLTTDVGRERLATDIGERVRRREREVKMLRGIQDKLDLMRDHVQQERSTIRVETNLAIWIVKKTAPAVDPEVAEEEEEDILAAVEQVGGRLLDLSEGGAALTAELDVDVNDTIELWSADSEIWIPPVTAGVLSVEQKSQGGEPIFHLHFLDPPLSELRAAIQTLQRKAGTRTS